MPSQSTRAVGWTDNDIDEGYNLDFIGTTETDQELYPTPKAKIFCGCLSNLFSKRRVFWTTLLVLLVLIVAAVIATARYGYSRSRQKSGLLNCDEINEALAMFAPVELTANISILSDSERTALSSILLGCSFMNPIYKTQLWSGNEDLERDLREERDDSQCDERRYQLFQLYMSPWVSLDGDRPLAKSIESRPIGANFYPESMTIKQFDAWLATLSPSKRALADGFYSIIKYGDDKHLEAVPYSVAYSTYLQPSAIAFRAAADAVAADVPALQAYLKSTADSFLDNSFQKAQIDWMKLKGTLLDVTVGPYEVYDDGLLNKKAAFEAYVSIVDSVETEKLEILLGLLQSVENSLPMDDAFRTTLGNASTIQVVNLIYNAGEARAGVQTAAYNLPNDELITAEYGNKRILLKNVQHAKFSSILVPIGNVVLRPELRSVPSFQLFFTHIVAHELMHGLGPHNIVVNGTATTVRAQLGELYSSIEEAKADISGLWMLIHLANESAIPLILTLDDEHTLYVTYMASMIRSMRFGLIEAHAKGAALQFNFIMEKGGIIYNSVTKVLDIDVPVYREAVKDLTSRILDLQGRGDRPAAEDLLKTYSKFSDVLLTLIPSVSKVPIDIRPTFPLAAGLYTY